MLARVDLHGYTEIADKGFAGRDIKALMAEFDAIFRRPDRKGEEPRFGGRARSGNRSNRWAPSATSKDEGEQRCGACAGC